MVIRKEYWNTLKLCVEYVKINIVSLLIYHTHESPNPLVGYKYVPQFYTCLFQIAFNYYEKKMFEYYSRKSYLFIALLKSI